MKHTEKSIIQSVFAEDCEALMEALGSCELFLLPENRFFVGVRVPSAKEDLYVTRKRAFKPLVGTDAHRRGSDARAYTGHFDFGHTTAEWDSVISLGIWGLRERIAEYGEHFGGDAAKKSFYELLVRVYDAALRFLARCAAFAREQGRAEMADGLQALTQGPPSTLYEAMQTSLAYYSLQQYFDGTVLRTMGRLDSLFYPYFKREEPAAAEQLVHDYLRALNEIDAVANLPFALGGTNAEGESLVNELSYLILNTYRGAGTWAVKLHLLCSDGMPEDLIRMGLDAVREGNNSIVFLSDKRVIESLEKLGADHSDAVDYHVVGCYECGARGELTCSCNARVNLPKALEYALNNGVDMITGEQIGLPVESSLESFDALCTEFERQLRHLCRCAMELTDRWESHYPAMHAAPILDATYRSALEKGADLYCENGAKYNNSSLNALGLATVADSLCAVKCLVFDERRLTLEEMIAILQQDWTGQEALRQYCKNRLPKFGTGVEEVDSIARRIVLTLADAINGRPNTRGGKYRLGLFSIDWRWDFGEHTAASADGRRCGEPISQNTGASFGADREGATAHLLSVASLDTSNTPNGAIVDLDLHSSAVLGENGLDAMLASLLTYFDLGGFAVHYNVLDADVLTDAKKHPEKYPNLQVRLCGWNVLFSTLSDKEKDEFIRRSMHC